MRNGSLMRSVRFNFVKMCIANPKLHSGDLRVCTTALADGAFVADGAEGHGVNGPGAQFLKGGKHPRLGKEDCRLGSYVSATGRATLLPAAALGHVNNSLHRKYSSATEMTMDVGGIVRIELAQTGEGIADCELLQWYVQEGDDVDEFQPLCEVQSDKASVEITSRYKGRVTKVNFIPGDIVKVGETLVELIIEETHTATSNGPSDENEYKETSVELTTESSQLGEVGRAIQATPAVRHLAKHYGINLADVPGSGDSGRILKDDVLQFVMSKEELNEEIRSIEPGQGVGGTLSQLESASEEDDRVSRRETLLSKEDCVSEVSAARKSVDEDLVGGDKIIPVRGFRRIMAKTMTAAVAVPHFHYTEDIKVDALVQLKDNVKEMILDPTVKITYLPFLIKALSLALKEYPLMNCTVNEDISEITMRASHNIGVGMATNYGLVVPNIKNVQNLSVLEIAEELSRLTKFAAANKLSNDDVTGGTITVSNVGSVGGKYGSPILNLPQVAIVAIGRIQKLPHYAPDGSIYPARIMGVTWGADHRVVDGATVAKFCNQWKVLIEQPGQFLLNMR